MKLQNKQSSWITLYTIPALIMMCLLYAFVWITGRSLFMGNDGFTMQYTMTMYFKEFWTSVMSGDFIHMDLTIGEGLSPLLTMGYYGLTDPLNTLFFAANEQNVFVLYTINMLLRWWFCGFCAGLYIKQHTQNTKVVATGALIYAFSGFMMIWQFCPTIIATGYLFPLLLLTFERAMRQQKYVGFILTSMVAYLTNYYMAILMSMAILVYAILWIVQGWITTKRMAKPELLTYTHTALSHAAGIAMSAWMLVPMIIYFLSGTRTEVHTTFSQFFFSPQYYLDAFVSFFTPNAGATAFFTQTPKLMISISPLLIPVILLAFQKKKHSVITAGMTVVCILLAGIPFVTSLVSLTGYPVHRWTFVLSIALCVCYAKHAEKTEQLTIKHKIIACVLMLLCAAGNFWNIQTAAAIINCIITVIACIVVLKPSVKAWYRATCFVCALMMFAWVLGAENISNFMFRGVWKDPNYNILDTYEQQLSENDINHRVTWIAHGGNVNSGTLRNKYTNHISWNSLPAGANDYNQFVQQYPTLLSSYWPANLNSRFAPHVLGAAKYFIAAPENTAPYNFEMVHTGAYNIWEAKHETSIGYGFTEKMSLSQFNTLNIAQKQVALLRYAIVDEECPAISIDDMELEYTINDKHITVNVPENVELYLVCNADIQLNTYELLWKSPEWWSTYPNGLRYNEAIINIAAHNTDKQLKQQINVRHPDTYPSYYAPERVVCFGTALSGAVTIDLEYANSVQVNELRIYAVPLTEYDKALISLQNNLLTNAKEKQGVITGNINAPQAMTLQIAVPYQEGWQAYVDGQPVDTFASGVQYIGLEVPAGEHSITLQYQTPGWNVGVIATIVGIVALLGNLGLAYYRKRKAA